MLQLLCSGKVLAYKHVLDRSASKYVSSCPMDGKTFIVLYNIHGD